jgi:hypothetical protein
MNDLSSMAFPEIKTPDLAELANSIAKNKQVQNGYANIYYESIVEHINNFNDQLDLEHEVGVQLVTFGQTIQFHVTNVGYRNPYLIIFHGTLDNGSPIELIQNVSQISFVLTKTKRLNTEKPKQKIGFLE